MYLRELPEPGSENYNREILKFPYTQEPSRKAWSDDPDYAWLQKVNSSIKSLLGVYSHDAAFDFYLSNRNGAPFLKESFVNQSWKSIVDATEIFHNGWFHGKYGTTYFLWRETPLERAANIMETLRNEETDGIVSCGGSGTAEVVYILQTRYGKELEEMAQQVANGQRDAPVLFGLSDPVHLMHFLGGLGVISPVALRCLSLFDERGKAYENDVIFEIRRFMQEGRMKDFPLRPVNQAAKQPGKLEGGMVLDNIHGTYISQGLMAGGKWSNFLLSESVHFGAGIENGKGLRRTLQRLQETKKLKGVDAIILSRSDADSSTRIPIEEIDISLLEKVVQEELGNSIPVFFGAPFGHPSKFVEMPDGKTSTNFMFSHAIPLMTATTIETDEQGKTILRADGRRTRASIAEVSRQFEKQLATGIYLPKPVNVNKEPKEISPDDFFSEYLLNGIPGCAPVYRVAGAAMEAEEGFPFQPRKYLACRAVYDDIYKGELPNGLRGHDVSGKDLLVASDREEEGYTVIKNIQMSLTELLLRGDLHKMNSLTVAYPRDSHPYIEDWLFRFMVDHRITFPVVIAELSPDAMKLIPPVEPVTLKVKRMKEIEPDSWLAREFNKVYRNGTKNRPPSGNVKR